MPVLLSLAIFDGWSPLLITIALFVVIEPMVSNLVEPILYGAQTGISSIAILIAVFFWTVLWGPAGLVLSTPLTVCLVVMGWQFPSLSFLHVLLGDEAVLTPESRLYQRLLAMDCEEAKQVLESAMKDKSLEELYDSRPIPALGLAEQDRHRNKLDDATEGLICETTKELIEDLDDKYDSESNDSDGEYQTALSQETAVEGEGTHPRSPNHLGTGC
jgi:hypothetical protein